jgi:hypothetical protein
MHGSILILAKKKAAGPGGYFDPMESAAPMAMGPMVFEMGGMPEKEDEDEDESEDTDSKGYDVETADKAKGSPSVDLRTALAELKAAAAKVDQAAMSLKAEPEMEKDEPTEEVEAPPAEAPKAKKSPPAFLKKTVMKY